MAGLTEALCDAIAGITPASIPAEAYRLADQAILDAIAAAVAGASQKAPQILADYVRAEMGAARASVIGFGFRTTLPRAALVNGAAMHALDFEPMANPGNHPASAILPGILALAEDRGLAGHDLAAAFILGYEIQSRLRVATGAPGEYRFHTPGVVGAIGGAVAAGFLLRLTPEQLRHAIGMAASRAGGLHANAGSMTKATHLGWAAAHGLESALLAGRGFQANPDILEAPRGFADAFLEGDIVAETVLGFGAPYHLVANRFSIKLFPAPYTTHWGIDAAIRLHHRLPSTAAIDAVVIDMPTLVMIDRPRPATGLEAIYSAQYTVACGLADGHVGIGHLDDATLARADISALLAKTRVAMAADRPAYGPGRWVGVSVTLPSGEVLTERCDRPEGHYARPPLSLARHRRKLDDCLGQAFGPGERDRVIAMTSRFHDLSAAEVADLIGLLGRPRSAAG